MIANVVPILRLRRATAWWSYNVPPPMSCNVGSLVQISLRGRPCLGIVWKLEKEAATSKPLTPLHAVLTVQPLIRASERIFIEWLAEYGLSSLSTCLFTVMPAALRKAPIGPGALKLLASWDTLLMTAESLAGRKQHLVLTPGHRIQTVSHLQKKYGEKFSVLERTTSELNDLQTWLRVASGTILIGNGRENALFAPWANLRQVTIIEPEDVSYYHEQVPYVPLVQAAIQLAKNNQAFYIFRSCLPDAAAKALWGNLARGIAQKAHLEIINTAQEGILGTTILDAIKAALVENKSVLILYNAHDHTIVNEAGEKIALPGIESLRKKLANQLGYATLPVNILFGTRAIFKEITGSFHLAILLSMDPLLAQENFADRVHGWGDVGRLLNLAEIAIIQTRQMDHPLIQSLRNNQFEAWCVEQITKARTHAIPPFAEQIVCSISATTDPARVTRVLNKLEKVVRDPWQISQPFQARRYKQQTSNILLYAPLESRLPEPLLKVLSALPHPWKVQRNPWYAL